MERYSDTAIEIINDLHTERMDYQSEYLPLIDAANQLAAYESTGIEPERVAEIVSIIGNDYDLGRLRELVEADKDERCVVLPCGVGDSVFHITTCKDFPKVLDGTMYGANGEPGTATGYYCPCELAENCPFLLEDGSFDCDKHKNTPAIYEDVVTEIVVNDMESFVRLDYSGCVDFDDFGKTVFRTREEAEAALEKMQGAAHE